MDAKMVIMVAIYGLLAGAALIFITIMISNLFNYQIEIFMTKILSCPKCGKKCKIEKSVVGTWKFAKCQDHGTFYQRMIKKCENS